jgi:hypothetical protein
MKVVLIGNVADMNLPVILPVAVAVVLWMVVGVIMVPAI